jgi:hypothetical protein
MDRRKVLVAALAVALSLIAGSHPRTVGDGGEYVALALNFASLHGPAIAEDAVPSIQASIAQYQPSLAAWDITKSTIRGRFGGRDFVHFWFYPLLAAPGVWVTNVIGIHPAYAFAMLNLCLLALAFWVCLPQLGVAASVLLFCGPIVWWIDKPHTEAFTFSLLAIAFATFRERPWWAMIAAGAASTQNPPTAVVIILVAAGTTLADRRWLRDARFWSGLGGGTLLALLHPVYSFVTHGTVSLLARSTRQTLPRFIEWSAVVVDPNIGILPNYPALALAALLALLVVLAQKPRDLLSSDVLAAVTACGAFLFSFAQTPNFHNGATPCLSRYALWLVPLSIPLLVRAGRLGSRAWSTGIWCLAPASALVCVFAFHPGVGENAREPTALAAYLWTKHPGWNNPFPEVFAETLAGSENPPLPVATAGCEKVLLLDRGDGDRWPIPCFPAATPSTGLSPDALYYANLENGRYAFVQMHVPDGQRFRINRDNLWPAVAEPQVRRLFVEFEWWRLRLTGDSPALRQALGVEDVSVYEGDGRYLFVIVRPRAGAELLLRLPERMRGRLVDVGADGPGQEVHFDGAPYEMWHVPVPAAGRVVVLALASAGKS